MAAPVIRERSNALTRLRLPKQRKKTSASRLGKRKGKR